MPDFICIGGQRTGTTWLHHVLSANPGIWMPPCKELHHFDSISPDVDSHPYRYRSHLQSRLRHYGLAAARVVTRRRISPDVQTRIEPIWDLRYFLHPGRSMGWYRSLFQTPSAAGRCTGEITPAYSLLPEAEIAPIAEAFPQLKIILILRDPVARAWSHAMKDLPDSALTDEAQQIRFLRDPSCFGRSDWPAILDRWRRYFPENRILLLSFEEIRRDPARFLSRLGPFLGRELVLPADGGSRRKKGTSSDRLQGIPPAVLAGIADLYQPLVAECRRRFPDLACDWGSAWNSAPVLQVAD